MERLLQDFRYALRVLHKNPGFTFVAVLTIGLGIGVNTAIFTVTNQLFLQPLPATHPEKLVRIFSEKNGENLHVTSYSSYEFLKKHALSLADLAAHAEASVSLAAVSGSTTVKAEVVSGNYFRMFGINAVIGRTIVPEDDRNGAGPVAVVSYRLWKSYFQQNKRAISEKIYVNGHPFDVIGVMPKSFRGSYLTADTDIWTAIATHEQVRPRGIPLSHPGWDWLSLTGRLGEDVTISRTQAELNRLSQQLRTEDRANSRIGFRVVKASPLPESLSENLAKALAFLSVISGLVLLVICANVAGSLLPRAVARRRETAIRSSMGATQFRLARQWLTESSTIALLGGGAGILVAIWCKEGLKILLPPEWQSFAPALTIDFVVMLFAFAASLFTGILCGLVPAVQVRKDNLMSALKEENADLPRNRIFGIFVAAQTSVSFVLLVVAALLLRSLMNSSTFDVGFDTDRLLLATVDTQRHSYTEERSRQFFYDLNKRLGSLPEIRAASYATVTPLGYGRESLDFILPGSKSPHDPISIAYNSIGPNYFKTMGIPLLRGRDFTDQEIRGIGSPVAIINETMAQKYWPQRNPIGQRIGLAGEGELEIIGIAKDVQYYTIGEESQSYVYLTPSTAFIGQMTMQIRTVSDPEDLTRTIIGEIAAIDPNLAPYDVLPLLR